MREFSKFIRVAATCIGLISTMGEVCAQTRASTSTNYLGKKSRAPRFAPKAAELADSGDYLGFRAYVRKAFPKLSRPEDWFDIRNLIYEHAEKAGYDLVYAWDRRPPVNYSSSGSVNVNESRSKADQMMLGGRFQEAFDIYQSIAVELRRLKKATKVKIQIRAINMLYPYILHSMARALYGASRFDEAYVVYRWIPQTYSKIREVQFEKMWTAFRGGRIDQALGAIASQSSSYFSRFLSPESYLVQIYLYKKLCRDEDYQQVLAEMKRFKKSLKDGSYTLEDFTNSETESRILWRLAQTAPEGDTSLVSNLEREAERDRIRGAIQKAFDVQKMRINDDLERALAYAQMTVRSGNSSLLKPIEKLPDRAGLFKMDLEIWPADTAEEWVDEIGGHRFVGESLCGTSAGS